MVTGTEAMPTGVPRTAVRMMNADTVAAVAATEIADESVGQNRLRRERGTDTTELMPTTITVQTRSVGRIVTITTAMGTVSDRAEQRADKIITGGKTAASGGQVGRNRHWNPATSAGTMTMMTRRPTDTWEADTNASAVLQWTETAGETKANGTLVAAKTEA